MVARVGLTMDIPNAIRVESCLVDVLIVGVGDVHDRMKSGSTSMCLLAWRYELSCKGDRDCVGNSS